MSKFENEQYKNDYTFAFRDWQNRDEKFLVGVLRNPVSDGFYAAAFEILRLRDFFMNDENLTKYQ